MQLRGRRQERAVLERRREPLNEGIVKSITGGSMEEKLQAIIFVAKGIEEKALGMDEAESILSLALHDECRQVRWSAILAISQQGSSMMEGLRMGLRNEDASVRGMGAAMIRSALENDKSALRSALIRNDSRVKAMARDLLHALLDAQQIVRAHSLSALRELARRSPVEMIGELDAFAPEGAGCGFELGCRLEIVRSEAMLGIMEEGKKFAV